MEHPTPQQILSARINQFTISIKLLLDARHTTPALILLYAAIDNFGALSRPETEIDTVRKAAVYFKEWARDYLLRHSQLTCTAEDLWGARCGLLHTHTPSSKDSREGKAEEIAYYREHAPTPDMQRELESKRKSLLAMGKVPVDVDVLYSAFAHGVSRFLADIQRDPQVEKRAFHHSAKLFVVWRYVA